MSIVVTLRGGSGDMKKSDYDSNLDGVIAIAQTEANMKTSDYDPDTNNKIAGAQLEDDLIVNGIARKIISNNLRHSHDAEVTENSAGSWIKHKSFTFAQGLSGDIRVKVDVKGQSGLGVAKLLHNGITLLGSARQPNSCAVYLTTTEDLNNLNIEKGDTIELWLKDMGCNTYAENFRIYYDNQIGVECSNS
jgi:hypothetical protein